jgi:hypothetical protein
MRCPADTSHENEAERWWDWKGSMLNYLWTVWIDMHRSFGDGGSFVEVGWLHLETSFPSLNNALSIGGVLWNPAFSGPPAGVSSRSKRSLAKKLTVSLTANNVQELIRDTPISPSSCEELPLNQI